MAEPYADMQETVITMHEMSQEETIRNQCLARILYQGDMNGARQMERQRINELNDRLVIAGRLEDLMRANRDLKYQETLLEEFGL